MQSYLKFIGRHAIYTAVEAVGLVLSMAFVIIIGCYAAQQYGIRNENPDRDRIYTFGTPSYIGETFAFTDELDVRLPEIETIARYSCGLSGVASVGDSSFDVSICTADKALFDIFTYYRFLSGGPEVLDSRTGAVVSESFANRAGIGVGETLKIDGNELVVGGIIEDFRRTLFKYTDLIVSPLSIINEYSWSAPYDHWGSAIPFVKVKEGTDRKEFAAKVDGICREIYSNVYGSMLFENCTDYRLDELFFIGTEYPQFNRGDMDSLKMLLLVALLVLVSAVFNYVNLNFALTGRRAKEMAVRRLVGAPGTGIFLRYIVESVAFTGICMMLSVLVALWFTPTMNVLINDPDIPIVISFSPVYVTAFILFAVSAGVISGLLPASLACRYRPIDIVSGNFRRRSKMVFSKAFIIVQNSLAIFLLGTACVMEAQYGKSLNRPMNADIDGKYFLMQRSSGPQTRLRDMLAALPCVRSIGRAQGVPGIRPGGQVSETRYGEEIIYRTCRMDSAAFSMLKIEIVEDFNAPLYNSVWFSERAWAESGFDDSYHEIALLSQRTSGCGQLAGVVKDFPVVTNNTERDYPVIIPVQRGEDMYYGGWLMDIDGDPAQAQEQIRKVYGEWSDEVFGTYVVPTYDNYLRDNFIEGLRPSRNNMRLIEVFMALALLISLLGLVSMSAYYAGENAKSIAIRKVFGGTVETETARSIRSYMVLVLLACVIGLPMAFYAGSRYLESYVYRLESWWWIPAAGAVLALAVSFLAVFWQTLSAARCNPADTLHKE